MVKVLVLLAILQTPDAEVNFIISSRFRAIGGCDGLNAPISLDLDHLFPNGGTSGPPEVLLLA
jgi:hypothetical protein